MCRLIAFCLTVAYALLGLGCSHHRLAAVPVIESYDLYVGPTFFKPSHFTIEKRPDTYVVREHAYRGKGGYSPQKLGRSKTKRISAEEWSQLIGIIEEGQFWTDFVGDTSEAYLDAAIIKFEGRRPGQQKKIAQYGKYSTFLYDLLDRLEKL